MRAIVGWIVGTGIVPALSFLRYMLAAGGDLSREAAFAFVIHYVWPAFALGGIIGFALLRLPRKQFVGLAFIVLGVVCGVIAAYAAPHFYPELAGKQSRLAARLALDSIYCFIVYWYIATGPHKRKIKGAGN